MSKWNIPKWTRHDICMEIVAFLCAYVCLIYNDVHINGVSAYEVCYELVFLYPGEQRLKINESDLFFMHRQISSYVCSIAVPILLWFYRIIAAIFEDSQSDRPNKNGAKNILWHMLRSTATVCKDRNKENISQIVSIRGRRMRMTMFRSDDGMLMGQKRARDRHRDLGRE